MERTGPSRADSFRGPPGRRRSTGTCRHRHRNADGCSKRTSRRSLASPRTRDHSKHRTGRGPFRRTGIAAPCRRHSHKRRILDRPSLRTCSSPRSDWRPPRRPRPPDRRSRSRALKPRSCRAPKGPSASTWPDRAPSRCCRRPSARRPRCRRISPCQAKRFRTGGSRPSLRPSGR